MQKEMPHYTRLMSLKYLVCYGAATILKYDTFNCALLLSGESKFNFVFTGCQVDL